mgnify:CR=1 FL=1
MIGESLVEKIGPRFYRTPLFKDNDTWRHKRYWETLSGMAMRANVELTPGGWVKVTQRRVPAFDLQLGVDANIGAELRLAYGEEHWGMMDRLGTSAAFCM